MDQSTPPASAAPAPTATTGDSTHGALLLTRNEPAAAPSATDALISQAPLLIAIVAIFYFLIIRPQNQERKRHETLLAGLMKDDEVLTTAGVYGKVARVEGARVELEIAPKVRIWVEKSSIKAKVDAAAPAPAKEG